MAQKLTIKQQRFVFEYLKDGNATRAYRDSYACNGSTAQWIEVEACKLLKHPQIAQSVERQQREAAEVANLDRGKVLGMLIETYQHALKIDQAGPAARCAELIGKAVAGGMFVDRSLVGSDTLSREQIIEQLSEGSEERRKLAERLLDYPRNFEEGANEATRKRFRSTGAG